MRSWKIYFTNINLGVEIVNINILDGLHKDIQIYAKKCKNMYRDVFNLCVIKRVFKFFLNGNGNFCFEFIS